MVWVQLGSIGRHPETRCAAGSVKLALQPATWPKDTAISPDKMGKPSKRHLRPMHGEAASAVLSRHFLRRVRLQTHISGCPLQPRLPPTASRRCEWTVGGHGLSGSSTMPSLTNLIDGVMMPLELRDFPRDSSGRRCSARGLLCLNQRYVERPKPTRDLQPPRQQRLFLLDNSPEITSPEGRSTSCNNLPGATCP